MVNRNAAVLTPAVFVARFSADNEKKKAVSGWRQDEKALWAEALSACLFPAAFIGPLVLALVPHANDRRSRIPWYFDICLRY